MSVNSREKGKVGERELAGFLRELGVADARRGVQYQGGTESPDVCAETGLPGVHIECKRVERLDPWQAIKQATDDAGPGKIPAVFWRRNRRDWLVVLRAENFVRLIQDGKEKTPPGSPGGALDILS